MVEVRRLAVEDICTSDMLSSSDGKATNMAVPLSRLDALDPDESTNESIYDWYHWVTQGYPL